MAIKEVELTLTIPVKVRYDESRITQKDVDEQGRYFYKEKTVQDCVKTVASRAVYLNCESDIARQEGAGHFITDHGFQVDVGYADLDSDRVHDIDQLWPVSNAHPKYDDRGKPIYA